MRRQTDDSEAINHANWNAWLWDFVLNESTALEYPANSVCLVANIDVRVDQLGNQTTLKLYDGADSWIFNVRVPNVYIAGFTFDGNRDPDGTSDGIADCAGCDGQPDRPKTNNFQGNGETSLIQAHGLVNAITIEDNRFISTQQGAIALVDQTEGCEVGTCIGTDTGEDPKVMHNIVIRRNVFKDIDTTALYARNSYGYANPHPDGGVRLNGALVFEDNTVIDVGTVSATGAPLGNATLVSGFERVILQDNRIENVPRTAFKHGANNNVTISGNTVLEARGAAVQFQTLSIEEFVPASSQVSSYTLPGQLVVEDNQVTGSDSPSNFVLLIGSNGAQPNHTVHPRVEIRDNSVSHGTGGIGSPLDAILIEAQAQYREVRVVRNAFLSLHRSAVYVVRSQRPGFEIASLHLEGNLMHGRGETLSNSLFSSHGDLGAPIRRLTIRDNAVFATATAVYFEHHGAHEMEIVDNMFWDTSPGRSNFRSEVGESLERVIIRGNNFDGGIDGLVADDLIWEDNNCPSPRACSTTFAAPR